MKLERRLANLGYGSRREVRRLFSKGAVTDLDGQKVNRDEKDLGQNILVHGEPMDARPPIVLILHKPAEFECSRKSRNRTIYELLPPRFLARSPALSPVGRLDMDTTGLVILTDDGELLHRLTHPKHHVAKHYQMHTARPLDSEIAQRFADGTLQLESEQTPLKPAEFVQHTDTTATLVLREGRYHQVKRMMAAVGNHVEQLHRSKVGPLELGDLPAGEWKRLSPDEVITLRQAVGLPTA